MFPNDLLLYRRRAGLTQEQLTEKTGIPRSRLSLWEGGRSLPNLTEAQTLAEFYRVTVSQLWPDPTLLGYIAGMAQTA